MPPNRVNRGHWPTKENRQNLCIFLHFPAHGKNCLELPKMLTRSRLTGKRSSRPYSMPFQNIFPWTRKMQKNPEMLPIFLGGPMAPIHPVWGHLVIFVWAGRFIVWSVLESISALMVNTWSSFSILFLQFMDLFCPLTDWPETACNGARMFVFSPYYQPRQI